MTNINETLRRISALLAGAAALAFTVVLAAPVATAAETSGKWWEEILPKPLTTAAPFVPGEQLEYAVDVLGKRAGTGTATIRKQRTLRGKQTLFVEAGVRSEGFLDKIFPIRDIYKTYLDMETLTPVRAHMEMDENRKPELLVRVDFDGEKDGRIKGLRTRGKTRRRVDFKTPLRALDPLSVVYNLRAREYKKGEKFTTFVYDGSRVYRMDVVVKGKDAVYTELGVKEGWKLVTTVRRADGSKPSFKKRMTFWLSADAHRVPLRCAFDLSFGKVDIRLIGVKGLRQIAQAD